MARVPLVERRLRWLVVALVAGAILVVSVIRPAGVGSTLGPLGLVGFDKWVHAIAYATLAVVLAYAMAEGDATRVGIIAFAGALAFGLIVELLQAPLRYRAFSLWDLLANAVGAGVVAVTWTHVADRVRFSRRSVLHDR